jgi:hypothetical protein
MSLLTPLATTFSTLAMHRSNQARREANFNVLSASALHQEPSAVAHALQFSTVSPSGERVLIKLGAPEQKTPSGILLPTAAEIDKNEGVVVAVGTGKQIQVCGLFVQRWSDASGHEVS